MVAGNSETYGDKLRNVNKYGNDKSFLLALRFSPVRLDTQVPLFPSPERPLGLSFH